MTGYVTSRAVRKALEKAEARAPPRGILTG